MFYDPTPGKEKTVIYDCVSARIGVLVYASKGRQRVYSGHDNVSFPVIFYRLAHGRIGGLSSHFILLFNEHLQFTSNCEQKLILGRDDTSNERFSCWANPCQSKAQPTFCMVLGSSFLENLIKYPGNKEAPCYFT